MHTNACIEEAKYVYQTIKMKYKNNINKFPSNFNVRLNIIKGDELKKRGFGLIWGVGKAAVNLPAIVILSIGDTNGGGIALCGKGMLYINF